VPFDRQEDHAHAVLTGSGQRETEARGFPVKEGVRNLDRDARAVSRVGVTTAGPTMREVDEDLNSLGDDVMGLTALDVGNETNPAGVALEARMVEALGPGQTRRYNIILHIDFLPSYAERGRAEAFLYEKYIAAGFPSLGN
jgi:hypothetical protein